MSDKADLNRLSSSEEIDNYINLFNQLTGLDAKDKYKPKAEITKSENELNVIKELNSSFDNASKEALINKRNNKTNNKVNTSIKRSSASTVTVYDAESEKIKNIHLLVFIILAVLVAVLFLNSIKTTKQAIQDVKDKTINLTICSSTVIETVAPDESDDDGVVLKTLFEFNNPATNSTAVSWYYFYNGETCPYEKGDNVEMYFDKNTGKLYDVEKTKELSNAEIKVAKQQNFGKSLIYLIPLTAADVFAFVVFWKKKKSLEE